MARRDEDEYEDDEDDRPRKEPHRGTTILILGIVAIAFVHLVGPFAWYMGSADLRKMRAGKMDRRGESETRVGYILGIIATLLMAVGLLVVLAFLVMFLGFGLFAVAAAPR